jgi:hypothetical protein
MANGAMFATTNTTSRIMLNGIRGRPLQHIRGLRQGDPLSPMLFILAMDPLQLQRLLDNATEHGLINPIGVDPIKLRTSLYANDVALFVRPTTNDVSNLQPILQALGAATAININLQKSEFYMIQTLATNTIGVTEMFQGKIDVFPTNYLGLPLHIGRTRRVDEQVLVDKIRARLPNQKGRLLNRAGRLMLVNSVLTSILVYSAYKIQFGGSVMDNLWTVIWKAKVEQKCRF